MLGKRISHAAHCFCSSSETYLLKKNSKPQHTYTKRNQMFKRYRKASQSPIPSWATNQQVLIIFFCAFRNKGEGAPAISDLVQRENNGTGYWIVNMTVTLSADCNISHIAVGLSNYLIHTTADGDWSVCCNPAEKPSFSIAIRWCTFRDLNYIECHSGAGQKTAKIFVYASSNEKWRHIRSKLRFLARFTKREMAFRSLNISLYL